MVPTRTWSGHGETLATTACEQEEVLVEKASDSCPGWVLTESGAHGVFFGATAMQFLEHQV